MSVDDPACLGAPDPSSAIEDAEAEYVLLRRSERSHARRATYDLLVRNLSAVERELEADGVHAAGGGGLPPIVSIAARAAGPYNVTPSSNAT